jgi:hypothetical protein
MGALQRRKGKKGENELAAILSDALGVVVKRKLGQARDSGDDIQVGQFRIEAKRRKRLGVQEWVDQVVAASGSGDIPIVVCRGDGREWLVVMRLDDALPMIRGELGGIGEP